MEEIIVEVNFGYLPSDYWINGIVNPIYLPPVAPALPEGFIVNGKINEDLLPDVNFKGITGDGLTEETAFTFAGFDPQKVDEHLQSYMDFDASSPQLLQNDLSWVAPPAGGVELPLLIPDPVASVSLVNSNSARLTSTVVPDAQNHNWYLATNNSFTGAILKGSTAVLNLTGLLPETTYFARVKGTATGYKSTAYSNVISFQTQAAGIDIGEEFTDFTEYIFSAAKGENDNDVIFYAPGGQFFGDAISGMKVAAGTEGEISISGDQPYDPNNQSGINGTGFIGFNTNNNGINNPDTLLPYSASLQDNFYARRINFKKNGESGFFEIPNSIPDIRKFRLFLRIDLADMINYEYSVNGGATRAAFTNPIAKPAGDMYYKIVPFEGYGIHNNIDIRAKGAVQI